MDVGGATRWSMDQVVSRREMLAMLEGRYGRIEPLAETSSAPAHRYRLPDGTVFGTISRRCTPAAGSAARREGRELVRHAEDRRPGARRQPAGLRPTALHAAPRVRRLPRPEAARPRARVEPVRGRALPGRQRPARD